MSDTMSPDEAKEAPRPRGRPRSADRDMQIREAAWHIIAQVGCSALTFEAIAQEIGCSRSTLYRRFASKAELISNLLDETALSFAPYFAADASPRDRVMAHARTCAVMYRDDRGAALIHIFAAARTDETIAQAVRAHSAMVAPHYYEPLRLLLPAASDAAIHFALHSLIGGILHHVATRRTLLSDMQIEWLVDAAIYLASSETQLATRTT